MSEKTSGANPQPDWERKYFEYAEGRDKRLFRAIMEIGATCEELKLAIGALHERILGQDGDRVIGELNHRVKQRFEKILLQLDPATGAWIDDVGRAGDRTPPPS